MQPLAQGSFIEFTRCLFAFLTNWHVKKKIVAETQQMAALLPWP